MNDIIISILGPSYAWEDELYYQGHPLSYQNQSQTERDAIDKALKMIGSE